MLYSMSAARISVIAKVIMDIPETVPPVILMAPVKV